MQDQEVTPEGVYKHDNHITPKVTVDIFILTSDNKLVLIERKNAPLGWALPGGFVDVGETTMEAAIREAQEETGCRLARVEQFHTYSAPSRDPRGHGITVAYIAHTLDTPVAADDAKSIAEFDLGIMKGYSLDRLGNKMSRLLPGNDIVFDHTQMILDLKHFQETGQRPTRE